MRTRLFLGTVVMTAAVLAITGCTTAAPSKTATKSDVPVAAATTEPTPTPTVAADEVLAGDWEPFDRVLISDDVTNAFAATGTLKEGVTSVPVFVPGDGLHTIDLTADTGSGEVQKQTVNVGGADGALMLIVSTSTRIPAHGLDKDKAHNQLDSYDIDTGEHIATYEFPDSSNEELVYDIVGATRGDDVVTYTRASLDGKVITGVNVRTGQKNWDQKTIPALKNREVDSTGYGTFLTVSDTSGNPGLSSCSRADGFDTATGKLLWTVDTAKIPDVNSPEHCADLTVYPVDQWSANRANTDDIGRYFGVTLGMSTSGYNEPSADEYRSFDANTGKELGHTDFADRTDIADGYTVSLPGNGDRGPLVVTNVATGKTVYTMDEQKQDDLNLQLIDLNAGYLYLKTTDGTPIVDVSTGDVVADNTSRTPLVTVGDYTFYDDGTLSLDPHLGAQPGPADAETGEPTDDPTY